MSTTITGVWSFAIGVILGQASAAGDQSATVGLVLLSLAGLVTAVTALVWVHVGLAGHEKKLDQIAGRINGELDALVERIAARISEKQILAERARIEQARAARGGQHEG